MKKWIGSFSASAIAGAAIFAAACAPPPVVTAAAKPLPGTDTIAVPLDHFGARTYHGLPGSSYTWGNEPYPDYKAIGLAHAAAVKPFAVNGIPGADGKYVLMSVGGTDASAAWCSQSSAPPCNGWTFAGRAVSDPSVNHSSLVLVNGAFPGSDFKRWMNPADSNYNRIRDTRLAPLGLSENQVQAIWMMVPDSAMSLPLIATSSDVAAGMPHVFAIFQALKSRYPNLQLLFVSSRVYGGYSPGGEPLAYESGFVVPLAVELRSHQARGAADAWVSWGPYLWSSEWPRADFDSSGARLSVSGEGRAGAMLLAFFKSSPYTRCWFLWAGQCG